MRDDILVTKPFLRWAGGKTWLLKYLKNIIGNIDFNNYHEPFLGGGAIFFSNKVPKRAFLSDLNEELINTYQLVKDNPEGIIKILKTYENKEEFYYNLRRENSSDKCIRAAKFIYLNHTSFNGIYRVNRNGEYNVPYGFRNVDFIEEEKIRAASNALESAYLFNGDFCQCLNNIESGDLVFLDPPYTVSHNNKENLIIENGTFDKGNNEATRDLLYPYLVGCFNCIKEELPEEWERDETEFGILTVNNTIHALIRILNDIVNHLIKSNNINPKNMEMEQLIENTLYFLAPLINFFSSITEEQRKEIRTNYGSGGKPKVWRTFQKIIHDARSEFNPEGLDEWIRDNTKQYNFESFKMTQELEYIIKKEFEDKLKSKYGEQWLTAGLPPKVYKQANGIMGKQNYANAQNGLNKEVSLWECVTIKNCRDIANFGSNWSELFETIYTRPEETKILGGKQAKTNWMVKLSDIAEKNNNVNYSVSEEEYLFLLSLYKWLKG